KEINPLISDHFEKLLVQRNFEDAYKIVSSYEFCDTGKLKGYRKYFCDLAEYEKYLFIHESLGEIRNFEPDLHLYLKKVYLYDKNGKLEILRNEFFNSKMSCDIDF